MIKFIHEFFEANPLAVCSEEISDCKKMLEEGVDKVKLSQKTSSLTFHIVRNKYFFKAKITVPQDYPLKQVG